MVSVLKAGRTVLLRYGEFKPPLYPPISPEPSEARVHWSAFLKSLYGNLLQTEYRDRDSRSITIASYNGG